MAEIIWSFKSYEDFQNIVEYIAKDSEHYASLTAKKIWREIRRIERNPKEARMVPEAGYLENIREFIVGNYRIIFQLKNNQAYLLTIHHNSRNLRKKSLLEQLK
jgi:plasmid stabilization system protein ParE